jgi:hypothetical protein
VLKPLWILGNGWAAAGIMRVLATIVRSNFASQMQSQQNDLAQWVDEILTGVWQYQVRSQCSPLTVISAERAGNIAAGKRDAPELRRSAELVRGLGIDGSPRSDDVPI